MTPEQSLSVTGSPLLTQQGLVNGEAALCPGQSQRHLWEEVKKSFCGCDLDHQPKREGRGGRRREQREVRRGKRGGERTGRTQRRRSGGGGEERVKGQ